jgi:myxalamid-type nonribosomal peptide synthetase MxaA
MTGAVPVERFLAGLFRQDIRLWAEGDRLRCAGPDAALTPDVTAEIRVRKADILAFLRTAWERGQEVAVAIPARHDPAPPLSFAQQRLWFIEQMLPGTPLHQMPFAIEARGRLDEAALEAALAKVASRHAVLRTRIQAENGEAQQSIVDEPFVPVARLDRRASPPESDELRAIIAEEACKPFDLRREPPLRLTLITLAEERTLLLFTLHHIAADGWSIDVLAGDLSAYYAEAVTGRPAALAPLPIQYGDFSAWQRERLEGPALARQLDFWRTHLGDPLPVTRLPTDFVRPPVQSHAGALTRFAIGAETTAALRQIAQVQGATLFATLFTVFNVLLYRYTGQADLLVGTPVANRRQRETESLIGLFVNPLPIRSRLKPHAGFASNLADVQATLWQAFEHQDLPFERLVEELQPERDPSAHPLFQLKFQFDPAATERISLPGVELHRLPHQGGVARLDLSLDLLEIDDGIAGSFEYATALFRPETIQAMAAHFCTLVNAIAADPARPISALALLSLDEHRQLAAWNETACHVDPTKPFHRMFEARAAIAPDAVALVHDMGDDVRQQTYGELNARANQLAHDLRTRGVGPEVVVGIALERSPDMVAAWLAVLKAGGAYLPLDPAYPAERLATMLEDSHAALVLSHSGISLPQGTTRLDIDTGWPDAAPTHNPVCITHPDHLAYVIYTSGSTGKPKGVLVPHGGLVNLTDDKIRVCDVRPGDCVLQFFSFSFDASIPELVMALAAGARLLLASAADLLPGPGLARLLERHGVTHVTMTPSALLGLPAGDYPALRLVLVGGEAPMPELIARWSAGRTFINAYGPTETSVNASMVACGNGHPAEPTLWPAANKQLHVLDDNLEPLPAGVPGELYIGGVGVARGYHSRPDLTAERFLPDPFAPCGRAGTLYRTGDRAARHPDGRIRLLGRIDHQVKIRGYRIELGEIEQALLGHPDVASAVVVVREDSVGDKRLVAYAVAQGSERAEAQAVRTRLRERLPRFLVPDAFVWLDKLPLTVNGKVDTAALPAPQHTAGRAGRPPSGPTEIALGEMFRELLNVPDISAEDDFFELGGHSLMATRLVAMALERFGIELSVLDLFTGPTVAALAARIEDRRAGASAREAIPARNDAWRQDIVLAADVRPVATVVAPGPLRRVLLTGATGFLGAYLLRELLHQPETEVWCLVRGKAGSDRLKAALDSYGIWNNAFLPRLHTVSSDLAQPAFGLHPAIYAKLAGGIDAIFHNGAEINHLQPYERLRPSNVEGTREILRLACAGPGRPLHYVSSLSVLPVDPLPDRPRFYEDDDLAAYPPPLGGYNRSKWVAEQLVAEAGRRGLPVTIYRPGPVSGDSHSGAFNASDFLCRLMQGYLHSGMAPRGAVHLDMLPVDYLARALVHLARRPDSVGHTYHLIHSRPVSSDLLFEACVAEGFQIRRVAYRDWHRTLMDIARDDPAHPLYRLVALFATREEDDDDARAIAELPFDTRNSRAALADTPFLEPDLDLSLFRTYLRAFQRAGAIPDRATGDQPR